MAYINVIEYKNSDGKLKEIYDNLIATRGKLAEVHKIQSLNPQTIVSHMSLYMDIMFGQSPLKRYQREMIAVVVSVANQCEYCMKHHKEALQHYWKDENRIAGLVQMSNEAGLSEADQALCAYAKEVTLNPELVTRQSNETLRQSGLDDREILDATLVISYFNFVNRMVMALGVEIGEDEVSGYKY